jgi:hypothetical protein
LRDSHRHREFCARDDCDIALKSVHCLDSYL